MKTTPRQASPLVSICDDAEAADDDALHAVVVGISVRLISRHHDFRRYGRDGRTVSARCVELLAGVGAAAAVGGPAR